MSTEIIMPQMGESIFEGTIAKWLKQPGDTVRRDEPLFEISTDKVDAEIPAPVSGVLREIKVPAGETVKVNSIIGIIEEETAQAPGRRHKAPASSNGEPERPAVAAIAGVTEVVMPQMGESVFEGTVSRWLKQPGESVSRDEPLLEISTDKVDAEIPAPASGVLQEIRVAAGKTVAVNTVLAVLSGSDAAAPSVLASAGVKHSPETAEEAAATPAAARVEAAIAAEAAAFATGKPVHESLDTVRSSPLVRRLAEENDVDLRLVAGSGNGGRITKEDILGYIEQRKSRPRAAAAPVASAAPPAAAPKNFAAGVAGTIEPMSVMRKKIAEHMVASKRTSAHVYTVFEVDMTRIVKLRETMKTAFERATGLKLTYTPFFARAVAQGLRAWPILNSSVEGESIHYKREINLGIAVALDWGLIVPVIKHADELSFAGLQRAVTDLGTRARTKKLKPEDVQDGTFTLTNPGIFGAIFGMPIINQPQVAILDIGGIRKQPVVMTDADGNDTLAIRSMMYLSLGFDHRVVDGAVADQFLRIVKDRLENWSEALI
jgi:2-oxoglutarate dehydrogenase E2 component (dihydrolipoamide succinyltransferase)